MRRNQIQMLVVAALVFFSLLGEVAPSEASTNIFQGFERYPVNGKAWVPFVDGKAYFRDAFVGGLTMILDATDGEEWGGSVVRPDGSYLYWYPIRFYANYQGKSNCFVCSNWKEPICGSNSIVMRWYTNVRPDADSGLPCYPTGLWRVIFTNNGMAFATPEFTLLPQVPGVPCFSQTSNTTPYANICKGPRKNGRITCVPCGGSYQIPWTIAAKGCALVCAVMVLRYHGVVTGVDGELVTPENLNAWLIGQRDGYNPLGKLNWDKLTEYSGGKVTYRGRTDEPNDALLREELCQHGPTVIRTNSLGGRSGGHFAVATGRDYPEESTWLINDPAGGVRATLAAGYDNRYYGLRMFTGPEFVWTDRMSGLTISLHSPAELLLTDPQGRRTGRDPIRNVDCREIPNSGYGDESIADAETREPVPPEMELDIREPMDGTYILQVVGTENGSYSLYIRPQDRAGKSPAQAFFAQMPTFPGAVHQYILEYSASPGSVLKLSGGFDGHGQRPSDVNKFLSYANPMSTRVQLRAGERTFPLMIFYGTTIQPQTFRATLNGTDITALFHPAPGGTELINLPLDPGSNPLVLSVDGATASGRMASDTDRLVFQVP
jgi:hypothetical protein